MEWYLKVLKNYANFNGRARRKEFWMFYLINFIIAFVIGIIAGMISFPLLGTIYSLAVLVPTLAVGVRRIHDGNKSGWFILIPFYNLYLLIIEGDKGANEYGEDPKNESAEANAELLDA